MGSPWEIEGWRMQSDLTSGGKVPSNPFKVEIVKSVLTAVETEAQRD